MNAASAIGAILKETPMRNIPEFQFVTLDPAKPVKPAQYLAMRRISFDCIQSCQNIYFELIFYGQAAGAMTDCG
jgi:hypothetical protein